MCWSENEFRIIPEGSVNLWLPHNSDVDNFPSFYANIPTPHIMCPFLFRVCYWLCVRARLYSFKKCEFFQAFKTKLSEWKSWEPSIDVIYVNLNLNEGTRKYSYILSCTLLNFVTNSCLTGTKNDKCGRTRQKLFWKMLCKHAFCQSGYLGLKLPWNIMRLK